MVFFFRNKKYARNCGRISLEYFGGMIRFACVHTDPPGISARHLTDRALKAVQA